MIPAVTGLLSRDYPSAVRDTLAAAVWFRSARLTNEEIPTILIKFNLPNGIRWQHMADFLTAAEAARRLGVKPATLYAYVSRGVLNRDKAATGRGSLFNADEVERLARRGRPRRPAGAMDLTIESAITEITADSFRFRGLDVTRLAVRRTFEEVAELLWAGDLPAAGATPVPWQATPAALASGRAAQAGLPAGTRPLDRLQVIVPAMAATDPLRLQFDPPAVLAAGRSIIAGMVDCLPASAPPATQPPIAERLWSKLCERRPAPGLLRALSAALVLLADHELAASTLAARTAASARADPYAVVGTGLGAMSGALHGGASLGVETLMAAARGPDDVPRVVGELLRRGEKVPGFGHIVYRGGDPRAIVLLDLVRRAAPKSGQLAVAEAVLTEIGRKSLPEPNIDFAVATLARVAGMITGAGEAIFAVSRTAGWIAHALEAYDARVLLRPRAVYVGRPATHEP
jgi:citrate synthase